MNLYRFSMVNKETSEVVMSKTYLLDELQVDGIENFIKDFVVPLGFIVFVELERLV